MPSLGNFIRPHDNVVQANARYNLRHSVVLSFMCVHGFLASPEKEPRRVLLTINEGGSISPCEQMGMVLSECTARVQPPFPLRNLYRFDGTEITTVAQLADVKGVWWQRAATNRN